METNTAPAELVGTAEAARILGKSHRTVHRLVQSGELEPAVRAPGGFAGTFLFNKSDVVQIAQAAQKAGA